MKFTIEVNLGNSKLIIEQECEGIKGLFKDAGLFSTFPSECNHCKSGNLFLNERKTVKGEYYEITCQDCGYRKEYGQYKEGGGLYPKDWAAPYRKDGAPAEGSTSTGPSALERAKAAKVAQAVTPEEYEDVKDDPVAEEAPKTSAAASDKRKALLDKFKKKGA